MTSRVWLLFLGFFLWCKMFCFIVFHIPKVSKLNWTIKVSTKITSRTFTTKKFNAHYSSPVYYWHFIAPRTTKTVKNSADFRLKISSLISWENYEPNKFLHGCKAQKASITFGTHHKNEYFKTRVRWKLEALSFCVVITQCGCWKYER